ncbi:N-acetyldiaminopimelate deacetylase [Paenisporosarcina cavernae]|uniref:Amidohydrolase n=1 Tax=Paenisporosarcina cavernae TaxID=2320858 RepID=A0A385YQV1_9BACL|nr:N-acetyldiaminopimelate deacetylase [Paenisporosarcina cavernae]AYC29079.1 amidohydrolase [Paenisporosarcina cavernae]
MTSFIDIRRALHQIPEIGFQEKKTQQFLLEFLESLPQERLTIHPWETGIFVRLEGYVGEKTLAWRTDIDALPLEELTELEFASLHPGAMHACGHDLHMAIALGVLQQLVEHPIAHHVIFLFQPAEEGPGGAEPMLTNWKAQLKDWMPDAIYACHIAPELPVGVVSTKSGTLFANTSELFFELTGKEGHAAFPHHSKDMTIAAASLLLQLQTIVSRNTDPLESAVVTIGSMKSGTANNIISGFARLEGTIRTFSSNVMAHTKSRIEAIARGIEVAFDCEVKVLYGSAYVEVKNDSSEYERFRTFAESYNDVTYHEAKEAMTGEDFGFFQTAIPGLMFWTGVDSEYGLHHPKLNPKEETIPLMIQFIRDFFHQYE